MERLDKVEEGKMHSFPYTPPRRSIMSPLVPKKLFRDEISSSGSNGGTPPWKKGLAVIGAVILSWVIFKPLLCKLFSFVKERYASNSSHHP